MDEQSKLEASIYQDCDTNFWENSETDETSRKHFHVSSLEITFHETLSVFWKTFIGKFKNQQES